MGWEEVGEENEAVKTWGLPVLGVELVGGEGGRGIEDGERGDGDEGDEGSEGVEGGCDRVSAKDSEVILKYGSCSCAQCFREYKTKGCC